MENSISQGFLIDGKVQRAGFRSKVRSIAKSYKLRGFAINLENYDESVLAVCRGQPKEIKGFKKELCELIAEKDKQKKEREELGKKLSGIVDKLDDILVSIDSEDRKKAIPLLENKKKCLRDLKRLDAEKTPYIVEKITLVGPPYYSDMIKKHKIEEKDDFVLVKDEKEIGARLDEGINALTNLSNTASNINYDIIDTDFNILEVKYGSLNSSIEKGFKEFPEKFASAFGVVLKEVYGLETKKKRKTGK
ncbi:MAG: acylphosphatase [Candidatus Altiarchaeota archaeon]|nr:acylphosphatase [Candidatus Altiarchaeota archaeon]